jgi:prepilin-type N-terminal cleavage/methylation domain-containing protein
VIRTQLLRRIHASAAPANRRGFTLVEMLVAVGLVLLMMSMFAFIFQTATGTMQRQRSLAENDQRVRALQQLFRNDFNNRLTREVAPFGPSPAWLDLTDPSWSAAQLIANRALMASKVLYMEDTVAAHPDPNLAGRRGYVSISENDPNNDTDDRLQFVIRIPATQTPITGRARLIPDPTLTAAQQANPLGANPNQPEFDDGNFTPNGVTQSHTAEVCYFLRAGTLYRRVVLLREPLVPTIPNDVTPSRRTMTTDPNYGPFPLFSTAATSVYAGAVPASLSDTQRNYMTDFDLSAYRGNGVPVLLGSNALDNGAATIVSLGKPTYRWGFSPLTGAPKEYVNPANAFNPVNPGVWMGGFTHRETSDLRFGFPARLDASTGTLSIYDRTPNDQGANTGLNTLDGDTLLLDGFPMDGIRWGEDVVMSGVHAFDIKVWDPAAALGLDLQPGIAGVDDDNDGIVDRDANGLPDWDEVGAPGSDDGAFVDLGHSQLTFDAVSGTSALLGQYAYYSDAAVDRPAGEPTYAVGTYPPTVNFPRNASYGLKNLYFGCDSSGSDWRMGNRFDTWHPMFRAGVPGAPFAYTRFLPPYRPINFGLDGRPGRALIDDDGDGHTDFYPNGFPDPKEIGRGDDQRSSLRAIVIRIRFAEPTSNLMRETSFVISLMPSEQ